jgi:UDP-2,4-diacetamido-2,4,6-trideoxy-beta-L-altropyranose hydrolase
LIKNKNNIISVDNCICFRCDFGPQYGLGHLMRCISIAHGLEKYANVKTYCLTNKGEKKIECFLDNSGMEVVVFPERVLGLDFDLSNYVRSTGKCITIFDNYDVTFEQMTAYKEKFSNLVAIDDLADRQFDTDIIINQNINAEKLNYNCVNKPQLLLGRNYALLRKNILKAKRAENAQRIMISFGGGDVYSRIELSLQWFEDINERLNHSIEIDLVLAVTPTQLRVIQKIFNQFKKLKVNYITNSYDLSKVMSQTDFAITAAGSTVFELAHMGVPQIAFMIDENQEITGSKINEHGFGTCLGYLEDVFKDDFVNVFFEFLENTSLKTEMSSKGKKFVDGKGVDRIVEQIVQYYDLAA